MVLVSWACVSWRAVVKAHNARLDQLIHNFLAYLTGMLNPLGALPG